MIEIKKEQNQYRVSFPEESIAQHYIEKFMDYLRYAELFSESKLTEEGATHLSDELKFSWWQANESKILKRIGK